MGIFVIYWTFGPRFCSILSTWLTKECAKGNKEQASNQTNVILWKAFALRNPIKSKVGVFVQFCKLSNINFTEFCIAQSNGKGFDLTK